MRLLHAMGLESAVPPTTQSIETEIVVYSKIGDWDGLQQATHVELHEQLESAFTNGTRCRVRRTSPAAVVSTEDDTDPSTTLLGATSGTSYVFTYKLPTVQDGGPSGASHEYNVEVDHDFYEGFRQIAEHRLLKTRYTYGSDHITLQYTSDGEIHTIEIPNVKYEVDVYTDPKGDTCEWCKIDIEVDVILEYLAIHHPDLADIKLQVRISHLAFEPSDMILADTATPEQQTFIDSLWSDHYRLTPTSDGTPTVAP